MPRMDAIVITISWEYFLGLLGALIAVAYYSNGRFTAVETDIGWLKEMISELLRVSLIPGQDFGKSRTEISVIPGQRFR